MLTGRGADFIIIDDPLKPDEAVSESQRLSVNQWYDSTLYSRLNDKANGCIILIMQRLHLDDLVGYVLPKPMKPIIIQAGSASMSCSVRRGRCFTWNGKRVSSSINCAKVLVNMPLPGNTSRH